MGNERLQSVRQWRSYDGHGGSALRLPSLLLRPHPIRRIARVHSSSPGPAALPILPWRPVGSRPRFVLAAVGHPRPRARLLRARGRCRPQPHRRPAPLPGPRARRDPHDPRGSRRRLRPLVLAVLAVVVGGAFDLYPDSFDSRSSLHVMVEAGLIAISASLGVLLWRCGDPSAWAAVAVAAAWVMAPAPIPKPARACRRIPRKRRHRSPPRPPRDR